MTCEADVTRGKSSWIHTTASTAGELSPTTSKVGHLVKSQNRGVTPSASKGFLRRLSSVNQHPHERLTKKGSAKSLPAITPWHFIVPKHTPGIADASRLSPPCTCHCCCTDVPLTLPSGESQCVLNERTSRHLCSIATDSPVSQPKTVLDSLPSAWACCISCSEATSFLLKRLHSQQLKWADSDNLLECFCNHFIDTNNWSLNFQVFTTERQNRTILH